MMSRTGAVVAVILLFVVVIASWSRLRYVDREGYDEPQRWSLKEYEAQRQRKANGY